MDNNQRENPFDQSEFAAVEEKLLRIADKFNNERALNSDERLAIIDLLHKHHRHSNKKIDVALGIIAIIDKLRQEQTLNDDDQNLLIELAWIAQHKAHQQSEFFKKRNQQRFAKHRTQGYTTENDDTWYR